MAQAISVLNLAAFSTAEQQELLTAAKAEVLRRITGRVQQGSSTGQSYSMALYTPDELNRLINALTIALGLDNEMVFVRPDFSHRGAGAWSGTGIQS